MRLTCKDLSNKPPARLVAAIRLGIMTGPVAVIGWETQRQGWGSGGVLVVLVIVRPVAVMLLRGILVRAW